ncbi:MAG: DUF3793 family protein [Lachnospiraceae bacterium]|nr:DUF3793 family protein [Lachnospiraceae bacterium]
MPVNEILQFRKQASHVSNMSLMLAMHCAPLLKGRKIANIFTVDRTDFAGIEELLAGTLIRYRFLKTSKNRVILFLYRRERLHGYLTTPEVSAFLRKLGYQTRDFGMMMNHLSSRMTLYSDGSAEFPHEIGLFLGYPLSDVLGFLDGRQCEMIGYWKVYDHAQSKLRLFNRYDELRDQAVKEVLNGKSIREIAV